MKQLNFGKVHATDAVIGSGTSLGSGIWRDDPLTDSAWIFINTSDNITMSKSAWKGQNQGHQEMCSEVPTERSLSGEFDEKQDSNKQLADTKVQTSSVEIGDEAPDFELEDSMGVKHTLSSFRGRKVLLSFFRFAACPVSLMRMDNVKQHYQMLKKGGITVICVYSSTPEMIRNFASECSSFVALGDRKGEVYKNYQVKKSTKALIQYEVKVCGNLKVYKPYMNFELMRKDFCLSGTRLLPADFLINEAGIIVDLFRAKDPYKQSLPFERLEEFIPEAKRCKCNKSDCWSVKCRGRYARRTV